MIFNNWPFNLAPVEGLILTLTPNRENPLYIFWYLLAITNANIQAATSKLHYALILSKQLTAKYFLIHHISSSPLWMVFTSSDCQLDMVRWTNPGHSHIQLTMSKAAVMQPDTNILQCLTLRLVNSHRECNTNRKRPSWPFKWEFSVFRFERNSGYENSPVGKLSSSNWTLQQVIGMNLVENQPCSIAQPHFGIQISHEHQRHPRFEKQSMFRETRWGAKKSKFGFWISTLSEHILLALLIPKT